MGKPWSEENCAFRASESLEPVANADSSAEDEDRAAKIYDVEVVFCRRTDQFYMGVVPPFDEADHKAVQRSLENAGVDVIYIKNVARKPEVRARPHTKIFGFVDGDRNESKSLCQVALRSVYGTSIGADIQPKGPRFDPQEPLF